LHKPGSIDRYNFDYSDVAEKSRCVAEMANIAFNINTLRWSGRRDSNPFYPHTNKPCFLCDLDPKQSKGIA
jgi:hypothetical protein